MSRPEIPCNVIPTTTILSAFRILSELRATVPMKGADHDRIDEVLSALKDDFPEIEKAAYGP